MISTLRFGPFDGGQQENHREHSAPHLHNLRGKKKKRVFIYFSAALTGQTNSQFEPEILRCVCCVFPAIIRNFRAALPLLSFPVSFRHIWKGAMVNGKSPSVIVHFLAVYPH